jgi:ligand-binding SRPBCC domain-containing protein
MIEVERSSELASPAEVVWAHATSMAGVNAELRPWLRMTVPRGLELRPRVIEPPGEFAFHSWLLLGGVLPIDRHALGFEAMSPEERWFHERSSSWLQREWVHWRSVEATQRGCRLTDRVTCVPKVAMLEPLVGRIVNAVFDHRHRVLRAMFGRQ